MLVLQFLLKCFRVSRDGEQGWWAALDRILFAKITATLKQFLFSNKTEIKSLFYLAASCATCLAVVQRNYEKVAEKVQVSQDLS